MDFEKLINFSAVYLSDYIWAFIETLRKPSIRFQPQPIPEHLQQPVLVGAGSSTQQRREILSPRLLSFVFVSLFIGFTISNLIPGRPTSPDLGTTAIIVFSFWLFHSVVTHWFCRLAGSTGTLIQSLSISLQLFAVLYVVSNFLTLIIGTVASVPFIGKSLSSPGPEPFVNNPIFFYFPIQFILMLIYLPLAVKNVHGLNFRLFVLVWVQVIFILCTGLLIFSSFGILKMFTW